MDKQQIDKFFETLPYNGLGPLHWGNETTGLFLRAVQSYWDGEPTDDQLYLLIKYCRYYIKAPIWSKNPFGSISQDLLDLAESMETVTKLDEFFEEALSIGLDIL